MKNSTARTTTIRYTIDTDLDQGHIVANLYPDKDQRIKLKWEDGNTTRIAAGHPRTDRADISDRFVRNCADMLCTVDNNGRFLNVSVGSRLLLGYDPCEVEGRPFTEFVLPEDAEKTVRAVENVIIRGEGFTTVENRYRNRSGHTVYISWSIRWCAEDQLIYCVGRDDSQKKAVEQELHKLNESLEAKIRERTSQLEHSMKELEAFSYSVSHDLRAPLRIINGYARLLDSQYKNTNEPEAQEFLDAIIGSTQHMNTLIDDLLNLSRMDKESVNIMDVDMNYLAGIVVQQMQNEDTTVTRDIVIHDLRPVQCDSSLMKQVWVNLLSNAIKYSKKKDNPKIEIGSYETDSTVVYYVKDNGAGFDMKFAAKLFGVFVRLHNRSEFEGTGVGLALTHRILTKHGGKIWANGKVDEGAVFYFSLPKNVINA